MPTTKTLLTSLDSITDGLMILDRDWRVIYINEAGARAVRATREQLLGKVFWDEYPDARELESAQELFRAVEENRPLHLETYYPRFQAWFENDIFPSPEGVLSIYREITDRKRAQQEMEGLLAREQAARAEAEALTADLQRQRANLERANEELQVTNEELLQRGAELRLLREEAETVRRIGQAISAELELEPLVQRVTDEATALTGAAFGAFFYHVQNEAGETYPLYALSGASREAFSQFPMPRATGIFQPIFRGTGVLRLDDVTRDSRYGKNAPYHGMPEGHLPVRSFLAVPVVSRSGEVVGGLFFGHPEAGRFRPEHERMVSGIAVQAAIGIDNARVYQRAREAEAAYRLSEQRYRSLVEASAQVVWHTNAAGEVVGDMPGWRALTGRSMEGLQGHGWLEDLHPEDRDGARAAWLEAVRSHGVYDTEYRMRLLDGTYRYFHARGEAVLGEDGTPREWIGTCIDITERREALARVEREMVMRRAIEGSMTAGVAAIDAKGRQTYVNPAFCRMLGWNEEELLGGTPPFVYWPPEERERISGIFREILAGKIPALGLEMLQRRKDDTRFHALVYPAQLRAPDGTVSGWLLTMHDVTQRKRVEAERERLLIREQKAHGDAEAARREAEELAVELARERDRLQTLNAELQEANAELQGASAQLREEQEEQQSATRLLRAMNRAAARLASLHARDEILQTVLETLRGELGARVGGIWLDPQGSGVRLERHGAFGLDTDASIGLPEQFETSLHSYKIAWVARYRRPFMGVTAGDDLQFDQLWLQRLGLRSTAILPLLGRERLHGVLVAFWRHELPAQAPEVLASLAASLSAALDHLEMEQRWRAAEQRASAAAADRAG